MTVRRRRWRAARRPRLFSHVHEARLRGGGGQNRNWRDTSTRPCPCSQKILQRELQTVQTSEGGEEEEEREQVAQRGCPN